MHSAPIPILMYHQVTPTPVPAFGRYTVTPRQFATQMKYLAWAGYTPINLDLLYAARRGEARLPPRPVVITFDDGFRACVAHATPILRARGFTAVFFLVAGLMGAQSDWLVPELGIAFPLIDWDGARQLELQGFQCGVHTLWHPRLTEVALERCHTELHEARCQMEEHLGHVVSHLAYPYGAYNHAVRAIVAELGYHTACSTRRGLSLADDDSLALHRVSLYGSDSLLDFIWRLRTGYALRESLRRYRRQVQQR